jgi:glycosyltransferase 2 family protein
MSKTAAGSVLRALLVLLALGFCAYGLYRQWDETVRAFRQLSWPVLLGAFVTGFAGFVVLMLAWRIFLTGLGSPIPPVQAYRVYFISQLGKYVPGKVWALVTQAELTREFGVPRLRSVSSTLLAIATSSACGLAVAAVTLPLTSDRARAQYWWLFVLAPVLLAALHPKIVTWCLDTALRLARQPPLEHAVSLAATLRAAAWTMLGWALLGVHTWLLCLGAGGSGRGLFFLATGAYALAFIAGFLVFIAPGGIGAREAVLVLVLSPVLPTGAALVVALASRVLLTLADLTGAGTAFALRGNAPRGTAFDTGKHPMEERS